MRLPAGNNRKIIDRLHNIKRFTKKTPRKVKEKLAGSFQHASFIIPGGAGMFSPIQAEGHKIVVSHHTRPNKISPILGGNYKTHGKTHHPGLPAGEQLTTLHKVLR